MSDIRPKGTSLTMLDGVERRVLFTLSVVDELQDRFDATIPELFKMTGDLRQQPKVVAAMVTALVNENAEEKDRITEEYAMQNIDMRILPKVERSILVAYGADMPEPEEDDDQDRTEPSS